MTKRVKMVRGSDNVFRDLGFPEEQARNLLLSSQIMICIEQFVERSGLTQARAAARLGLTQSQLQSLDEETLDRLFQTFQEWNTELNRLSKATGESTETRPASSCPVYAEAYGRKFAQREAG